MNLLFTRTKTCARPHWRHAQNSSYCEGRRRIRFLKLWFRRLTIEAEDGNAMPSKRSRTREAATPHTRQANLAPWQDRAESNGPAAAYHQPDAIRSSCGNSYATRACSLRRNGRASACSKRVRRPSSRKREAHRPWPAQEETLT